MIKAKVLLGILLLATARLQAAPPPAWVQGQGVDPALFPSARFLTGYGCSGPKGTEAERRLEAQAMAREALVSSIRARVTAEFVQKVTQADQSMHRFVQNWVTTRADLEVPGLDTFLVYFLALAAMDLTDGLPRGTRVLMDRVTYAETPFCGSFSAYVEQVLADQLAALG
jgi:hypothetical protein